MRKGCAILAAWLALTLLAGCQKTPGKPVVVNKGDSHLEQKILETAKPETSTAAQQSGEGPSASPTQLPRDGERIQETLKNKAGNVELTVDAEVIRHDDQSYPAVAVVPQPFSQQQADSIIQALIGDLKLYNPTQMSRERINEQLIFYKQRLEKAKTKRQKDTINKIISDYESMLETAVSEDDLDPAPKKFSKSDSIQYSQSIVGKFKRDGQEYVLMINNSEDGKLSNASMYMVGPETYFIVNRAGSEAGDSLVKIPYDQAWQQAQQLVKDLQSDLSLGDAFVVSKPVDEPGTGKANYSYQFVFTREVNGVHVVYDTSYLSPGGTEEENSKNFQEPWPYESLTVTIDEKGVQNLDWVGPSKVEKVLSKDVSLLPFSEIMNVFGQMVLIRNSAWETCVENNEGWEKAVIHVDRITLGLMRVQSQNEFYLIPVWDFYGSEDYAMSDGTLMFGAKGNSQEAYFRMTLGSLLTINAIDGSIIDRRLGY